MTAPDYIILAGFFVVMLAIGGYFAGRMKNLQDFFSGSRQVPWWVSGISLYMTTFSAFTFVAYSTIAYNEGFVAITIWWLSVPCAFLTAHFLAARWRRAASTSPLEYLETRFGPSLRQSFAWLGVPLIVIDDGLKLFVIGKMVTISFGIEHEQGLLWSIVACGLIILVYTFLGGLWAVMITDFVQFLVMATAVIVLIPLAWARVGGLGSFYAQTPDGFWTPTGEAYPAPWLIAFTLVLLLTYAVKWPYVQRYYSVATDREARKVGYLVAALMFIGPPLLFFPAMAARVFMPDVANANDVYPLLCRELLPVGMLGVVIAAMFSATMSMLSSDYNSGASVITNDLFKRLWGGALPDKALVWVARFSTLIIGLLALGMAVLLAGRGEPPDLVNIMAGLFSVLLPPIAIPMVAGLLNRHASNAGALAGFLAGAAAGVAGYALSLWGNDLAYLATVTYMTWITSTPTLITLVLVSMFYPDDEKKGRQIMVFLHGLTVRENMSGTGVKPLGNDATIAVRIIGIACMALGVLLITAIVATGSFGPGKMTMAVGAVMAVAGALTAVVLPLFRKTQSDK